jgi:hypothetical protein
MDRKQLALTEGCATLQRRAVALVTVSAKLVADKKVVPSTHTTLIFYSLAFSVLIPHLSMRLILRHFYEGMLRLMRFEEFGISVESKRIKI